MSAAVPDDAPDELLVGSVVRLRPLREDDLEHLREWYNRPDIFPYMARDTPLTREDQRRWYEAMVRQADTRVFALERKNTGALVGSITLRHLLDPARCGELGILVGYPGSGLGSDAVRTLLRYAFTELGLKTVCLAVRGDNRRAITAYMRAGFRPEGVLRQRLAKSTHVYDLFSMSILREEFLEDLAESR